MDFNWYLNRQGVRGAKGVKGDKGDSPIIEVASETANEYILKVVNPDGTIITSPNLRGNKIDTSTIGDYVKYNLTTGNLYTSELDLATTEVEGAVRFATDEDFTNRADNAAISPASLVEHLADLFNTSSDNLISLEYDAENDIVNIDTSAINTKINTAEIKADAAQSIANQALTNANNAQTQANTNKTDIASIKSDLIPIKQTIEDLPTDYVTTDTTQTVSGTKVFSSGITAPEFSNTDSKFHLRVGDTGAVELVSGSNPLRLQTENDMFLFSGSDIHINANTTTFYQIPKVSHLGVTSNILTENRLIAGDNVNLETTTSGIVVNATSGSGETTQDINGIEGDYHSKYGIVDYTGSNADIFTYTNNVLTVNAPLVLNCAGNAEAVKTTIASTTTLALNESNKVVTVFYADGELLECATVDYQTEEPTDNGVTSYQAWFNPDKTTNPNQRWQFKSNDTGNVWRMANAATPIVDCSLSSDTTPSILSAYCFKYRHIDKKKILTSSDVNLSEYAKLDSANYFSGTNNQFANEVIINNGITFPASGSSFSQSYIKVENGTLKLAGELYPNTAKGHVEIGPDGIEVYDKSNINVLDMQLYGSGQSKIIKFPNNYSMFLNFTYNYANRPSMEIGYKNGTSEHYIKGYVNGVQTSFLRAVDVDGQTIQMVDGKLHCNLDELGNEVNDLSGRVTALEADIGNISTILDNINGEVI